VSARRPSTGSSSVVRACPDTRDGSSAADWTHGDVPAASVRATHYHPVMPPVPNEPDLRAQLDGLDRAVYRAIAATPTPGLDRDLTRLSRAANRSVLWGALAAMLSCGGPRGRRAAVDGLVAVAATSAVVNLVAKPLGGRRRPNRAADDVPAARHVEMPESTSFPSGHSASAFAFASAVTTGWPTAGGPVQGLAFLVAYSRVHTGVHYPGDVLAGSIIGSIVGPLTTHAIRRWRPSRR
jgi:membrane-associated phospholipid phosphatase